MLEDALLEFGGTILTISHDRFYLDRICTRTIEIKDGVVRDYPGGYTHYISQQGRGANSHYARRPPKPARR